MFLVTGATGNVGRHVLTRLITRGHKVRALSRRPDRAAWPVEVEVVAGDLTDRTALAAALGGVEAAFLFAAPGCGPDFAAAAEAAGVRRVVLMSSGSVGDPDAVVRESPIAAYHAEVEQAVRDSRLEWTFLRPGAFATNSLAWANQTKSSDVIRGAYAEAPTAPIHEADIADAAVAALTQDDHGGQAYRLTGPASLTNAELARVLGQTLGRPITYQELPPEQVRAAMIEHAPAPIVDSLLAIWAASVGHPAEVTADVDKVTGHPARSFSQWVADHARDF
ncbi:MAG TPA: NAD(P)H-binding protein [Thermoleophilia bacterium]|nr:NAD(P)H-binding protein [Thermoleophilia bacterium]